MSKCKGCGKEILWMKTTENKMIPLDPKPPIYEVHDAAPEEFKGGADCYGARADKGYYVSHFATCPKANDFSASKKQAKEQP